MMRKPPLSVMEKDYLAVNASALVCRNKTGVEWYTYQVLKYLSKEWKDTDMPVVLFVPYGSKLRISLFNAPNWHIQFLKGDIFWTQFHLTGFLNNYPSALLFSPSYASPFFLDRKISTIDVLHGLEGKHFPHVESLKQKVSRRLLVLPSLRKSRDIISVSEHTKADLEKFFNLKSQAVLSGCGTLSDERVKKLLKNQELIDRKKSKAEIRCTYIGGLERRKNISAAARIFIQLKNLTKQPVKLYLLGGSNRLKYSIDRSPYKKDIFCIPYVSNMKKEKYLLKSHFLLYPSYYEGFGFPVLEAQAYGTVPVVMEKSGLKETGGKGIVEFKEEDEKQAAMKILKLMNDYSKFNKLQKEARKNVQRFGWEKCAKEIKKILLKEKGGPN